MFWVDGHRKPNWLGKKGEGSGIGTPKTALKQMELEKKKKEEVSRKFASMASSYGNRKIVAPRSNARSRRSDGDSRKSGDA